MFEQYNDIPKGLDKKEYNKWIIDTLKATPSLIRDWKWRVTHLYHIVTKEGNKILFFPNKAQQRFIELLDKYDRFVILKSRQLGMSTFVAIYFLDKIIWEDNKDAGFIAHTKDAAQDIFDKKVLFALENTPDAIKAMIDVTGKNAKKLKILKKSGSTNNYNVLVSSRGGTYHYTHISELGKMSKANPEKAAETLKGSMSSIAGGNKLFIESTAEGASGLFYETFMSSWKLRSKFTEGSIANSMLCFPLFFNWTYDEDEIAKITTTIDVRDMDVLDIEWLEFQKDNDLTDQQLTWYYMKWLQLNKDTNSLFQEYPTTAEDAFLASGQCMFSQKKLSELMLHADENKPIKRYDTLGGELSLNPYGGPFYVFKEPVKGRKYILGADTGEGLSDGDYSTCAVVDSLTQEPVAFYWAREAPYEFAATVNCIGKWYNNAIVGVETNQNGYYVNDRLVKDFVYPNMYIQQIYDNITRTYTKKVGWDQNQKTRKKALIDFKTVFSKTPFWYFKPLLEEMMTFVMNKRGKFEALPGKHDDLVMCTAIAYGIIGAKQSEEVTPEKKRISRMGVAFGDCTIEEFLAQELLLTNQ